MHKAVKQGLERLPGVYSAVMLTKLVKESFLRVLWHGFLSPKQEVETYRYQNRQSKTNLSAALKPLCSFFISQYI